MTKLYRLTEHGEGVINQMDGLIEEVTIDYKAAKNAFWAHAADLLKPTVSSSGIDRAVDLAVDVALRVTEVSV